MGTFSIIVGLIVFAVALFPNLGYFILIPAAAGLIIGVCKLVRDGYCPWGISGVILNGMAIILAFFWTGLISMSTTEMMEDAIREMENRPEVLQVFYPVVPPRQQLKKEMPKQPQAQQPQTAIPAPADTKK